MSLDAYRLDPDRWWARFLAVARTKQRLVRLVSRTRDLVRRRRLGWRP